jgi:predicted RND superfamily exporter protein
LHPRRGGGYKLAVCTDPGIEKSWKESLLKKIIMIMIMMIMIMIIIIIYCFENCHKD